ncbi:MFS transporter [Fibrobacterota bacterium]
MFSSYKKFLDIFNTKEKLDDADVKKGIKMVTVDGICSSGMGTLQGGVFLSAFALAIGASNYEIGLLATFAFLSQLIQIPGLFLVRAFKKRRAIVFACASASRMLWLFIILIPLLFVDAGISFLLQWLIISMLVGAMAGPAWNSLLRDVLPSSVLGTTMARRMMLGTILALVLTLCGGYFVDWWKAAFPGAPLYAYSILFSLGLAFGIIGALAITRMPENTLTVEESLPMRELFAMPLKDMNFRSLIIFSGLWTFAINMAVPFFVIYMLKRIGFSLFMVTVFTVTSQVANIIFIRIWGRLADRFSNKSVLAVSGPMFLLAILGWTFTTMPERYFLTVPLVFLIHILSGVSMAGVSLASGNIALKLSPKKYAYSYMTIFGIMGAIAGSIAPMLGGVIADFFAVRELSFAINWSEPARQISVYALNFKALDFLFFASFLAGIYAIHRLAFVKEEGEVDEKVVIDHLKEGVFSPFKHMSSVGGLRRMGFMPLSYMLKMKRKVFFNNGTG